MSLLDLAKRDIQDITSNVDNGFAVSIKLTAPGGESADVTGIHKKINLGVDPGTLQAINSTTAAFSVAEKFLVDAGYPYRSDTGEVNFEKHRAIVKDSTGEDKEYTVEQWFPDETVGLIVFILGKYGED